MNALIFDFDGTIADSFDTVLDFLLRHAGKDPASLTPEQRASLRGLSMKELALRVGIPRWRLLETYFAGKHYFRRHLSKVSPIAGMPEALQALHQEQYQLFILSSNSRRNIQQFLVERGLSAYFTTIYGNAGWFGKGRNLRKAMRQHGLDPRKTIYIGDEERDIVAARSAGTASVAVNWGFASESALLAHTPTLLVRNAQELQKALVDIGREV